MTKPRNRDREILEIYLLNLLLAYRPILRISGFGALIYAILALSLSPVLGGFVLIVALVLLVPSFSYSATLYLAKLGAWIGTLGKKKDDQTAKGL